MNFPSAHGLYHPWVPGYIMLCNINLDTILYCLDLHCIYIYIHGRKAYLLHKQKLFTYHIIVFVKYIIVSQLKPKQVNENNCYLHLSTVTLLPFFQVAISTFPPSIHSLSIWHVGKAHPSTWVQILLQLSPVALVEHPGEWVPEYEHSAEKHHDKSRQWFRAPKVITYQS